MKYFKRIFLPFILMAIVMSLYQVIKFYLLKGQYTIWESHIMTIVFTALLATIVSLALSNWTEKIEQRKKEVELREARLRTLQSTMRTVQHIVNNFLNCVMLIRLEAEEEGALTKSSLEKLESNILEVSRQLVELSELEDPGNSADFKKFFPPKNE
ncbi:MAG: hypothetical protein HY885_16645 [Deltaproteobacteria bacterium]|nr:hypothetical protein [Deltaproteobacteria bacterium]